MKYYVFFLAADIQMNLGMRGTDYHKLPVHRASCVTSDSPKGVGFVFAVRVYALFSQCCCAAMVVNQVVMR